VLEIFPVFVPAQHALDGAYVQSGRYREMIGVRQDVLKLSGNPDLAALIGEDFKQTGALGVLKSWEEGLQE